MQRVILICFFLGMLLMVNVCQADDSKESDDDKKSFGDTVGESMKGFGDWFKGAAEDVKDKSESGIESMRDISEQAKEKSQSGLGAMKDFAGGIADRFSKAKEKLEDTGDQIKDAFGNAAEKSKDEFETAASKVSKHVKEASGSMFSLFG